MSLAVPHLVSRWVQIFDMSELVVFFNYKEGALYGRRPAPV